MHTHYRRLITQGRIPTNPKAFAAFGMNRLRKRRFVLERQGEATGSFRALTYTLSILYRSESLVGILIRRNSSVNTHNLLCRATGRFSRAFAEVPLADHKSLSHVLKSWSATSQQPKTPQPSQVFRTEIQSTWRRDSHHGFK